MQQRWLIYLCNRATLHAIHATGNATMSATESGKRLRSAALKVLERNQQCSQECNVQYNVLQLSVQQTPPKVALVAREVAPFGEREKRQVLAWLDRVEEDDKHTRAEIITLCETDRKARAWYLTKAIELGCSAKAIAITDAPTLADCPTCQHQERDTLNPQYGLSFCAIRRVTGTLPHVKRQCDKYEGNHE